VNDFIESLVYLYHALYNKRYFKDYKGSLKSEKIKIEGLEIPTRTQALDDRENEPISFIFLADSEKTFEEFLKKTGWLDAEPVTFFGSIKGGLYNMFNLPFPRFQMTPYFWNGKTQDYNIQKPSDTIRKRHHSRLWKTGMTTNGLQVYVAMASYDKEMEKVVAHTIDPDLDKEREFLFNEFKKTGMIKSARKIKIFPKKIEGAIFMGDCFFTDGEAYVIYLK
jgi:hypothetical protein